MVQLTQSLQIEKDWTEKKKINPELVCNHPDIQKEYAFGASTEDFICMTCGKIFTREERNQIREKQSNQEER